MAGTAVLGRLTWLDAEVVELVTETTRVRTIVLDVPGWPGHRAGQHLDVRLTAEDGYQAQRSYSIASPPGEPIAITVEVLDDGEVSPYLAEELREGDEIEVRGPIGGYFVWEPGGEERLLLVAGGSGIVPLMAMIRHRAVTGDRSRLGFCTPRAAWRRSSTEPSSRNWLPRTTGWRSFKRSRVSSRPTGRVTRVGSTQI